MRPKTPWKERICKVCYFDTKKVGDGKSFILEYPIYANIRSQFHYICDIIDLHNLLSHENQCDTLGKFLFNLFNRKNKMLKQIN